MTVGLSDPRIIGTLPFPSPLCRLKMPDNVQCSMRCNMNGTPVLLQLICPSAALSLMTYKLSYRINLASCCGFAIALGSAEKVCGHHSSVLKG